MINDNAMVESIFATLECELLDPVKLSTHAAARAAVFEFIEGKNADDMTPPDALFRSQDDWAFVLKNHVWGVVDGSCWENRLDVDGTLCRGTPFWPLIRAIDLPFAP